MDKEWFRKLTEESLKKELYPEDLDSHLITIILENILLFKLEESFTS